MNDDFERIKPFLLNYVSEVMQPLINGGKNQYICPLCGSGTGSHHSGLFTVYPETNWFCCFSCGAKGDIFELYGKINGISDFAKVSLELYGKYGKKIDLTPKIENSFMWRSTTKNIKRKRGMVHLFNSVALTSPYCFVVEGEIDCMSLAECGFACVGLGSTSNIRKIFEHDTSKTVLIIAMDGDFAGAKATRELEKLCDEHKTPYITAFPDVWCDCKDANELLVKDRSRLIASLQSHSERATTLDKDQ